MKDRKTKTGLVQIAGTGKRSLLGSRAVNYVISQQMKKTGYMRWSRKGANALLQVR